MALMQFYNYFCGMMDVLDIGNKTHDEKKQGLPFVFENDSAQYSKYFYIESYGCAMNFADTEVVASILMQNGYGPTKNVEIAQLIFVNTCSIREKAELAVRKRLTEFKRLKQQNKKVLVGVLGCMAERLKTKFIEEEKLVDIVVGPDAYRTLPTLIADANSGRKMVNVLLSREETYADIAPVRLGSNGVSAYVSIMRGCNNMCSFCVVPFTRGRERSRDVESILTECRTLIEDGFKEIILLGQNVDSYYYTDANDLSKITTFAQLLEMVALLSPKVRVRFSTSHPKDITDDVLFTIKKYANICNYIHLPVQSGNTRVLQIMNRNYSREWYISKVNRIREIIPDCGLSSDIITGFCTETEEEHKDTLSLMEVCKFDFSYMYYYSERPGTLAERRYTDDVSLPDKKRRLQEIVDQQGSLSHATHMLEIGKEFEVLIESESKKSSLDWMGRNEKNQVIVFGKGDYLLNKGSYCIVKITDAGRSTLIGEIIRVDDEKN
jgi:tRNA-2-methylthio-N6-dimethylallyladenosine synthase